MKHFGVMTRNKETYATRHEIWMVIFQRRWQLLQVV